jgi:hypothetical protein
MVSCELDCHMSYFAANRPWTPRQGTAAFGGISGLEEKNPGWISCMSGSAHNPDMALTHCMD